MAGAAQEMFAGHAVATSDDIDHARDLLSEVFLPLDFAGVTPSTAFHLSLNVLHLRRITLGYMSLGDAIRIDTSEATNYHVDIPLTGTATMGAPSRSRVYGTRQKAAVFNPGLPVILDCDEWYSQLALMLPHRELQLELENLLGYTITRQLDFAAELDLTGGPGRTFLQTLRLIDLASQQDAGMLQHPLAELQLEQFLMHSLLFSQPHNYSEALRARVAPAGRLPVADAMELLQARPADPWTVASLAAEVWVSVRSLQEGFHRAAGTTPMGYLRQVRLERVHVELAGSEPGMATVTQIAMRWGFTHMGRFASEYRARFSERPSDTMRRPAP